ncbi:MAG: carbohydrate ABC transporter permease [Polyangiaceae bacterium]
MSARPRSPSGLVFAALALLAAVAWVGPYVWMLATSLRPLAEIVARPDALVPEHPTLGAYRELFATLPVARTMALTIALAVVIALLQIAIALPAGYALAKLDFRGRRVAFALVLACLLVPAQVTFVPLYLFFAELHLVNTIAALVLPFAVSALGTFLVRQAMQSIPDEIVEAARLDGASEWTIVYRILAPLMAPTLASLFLVSFVFHYSDYFWPLVMTTDDSVRTLPLGVALLREQGSGVRWHVLMAGNVVLSAPILALFALVQQKLVQGLSGR